MEKYWKDAKTIHVVHKFSLLAQNNVNERGTVSVSIEDNSWFPAIHWTKQDLWRNNFHSNESRDFSGSWISFSLQLNCQYKFNMSANFSQFYLRNQIILDEVVVQPWACAQVVFGILLFRFESNGPENFKVLIKSFQNLNLKF